MNELKKLTWKFFWQQKLKEIMIALVIVLAFIFIPYLVGTLLPDQAQITISATNPCYLDPQIDCGLGFWDYWVTGIFISLMGGFIIALVIEGLSRWIKSNWKKASQRANEELDSFNEEITPEEGVLDLS